MVLSWGYSLRVALLSFSHPLIHSVHCTILYANKFQAELFVITTDNSRGKTKQNLSVRTLSLRNFVCTPAVIHSALECFLPTSSYLFLFTNCHFGYLFSNYRFYWYHTRKPVSAPDKLVAQEKDFLDVIFIQTLIKCSQSREEKQKI